MRLIVAPHIDDECLGCSSVLKNSHVVFLGVNDFHVVDRNERLLEVSRVSEFFNYDFRVCEHLVDNYKFKDILDTLQVFINEIKPDEIYIPHPSYNQDHRAVYEACFTALRHHDTNFFVKKVFVYEEIHHNLWDKEDFVPNYFRYLDINHKIKGYLLHKSQVRQHRSPEMLENIAKFRGYQSGLKHAEAFKILRWVD
jgi:LmbE family N-acetylglucosaminyl deacetylase